MKRYKKIVSLFLFCIITINFSVQSAETDAAFMVHAHQHQMIPVVICVLGDQSDLYHIAQRMQKDLSFSEQCVVTVKSFSNKVTKKGIKKFFEEGFLMALFINKGSDNHILEWRLYETASGTFLAGKQYKKRGNSAAVWAHALSDMVWPIITGSDPFFSTKIAYCKAKIEKKGRRIQHVYIADFDGTNEEILVDVPTICVAPCWHQDLKRPLLWYSEYGRTNVRMMQVDMDKNRKIISDGDGITMLPAFSPSGNSFVYCASKGSGHCQLFLWSDNSIKTIAENAGNSLNPLFGPDESTLFFCSDLHGKPQIYEYNISRGEMAPITHGGFCTSPAYSKKAKILAYAKMVRGYMQIFFYDITTKKHTQITSDPSNKGECSWSPCGHYLLFGESRSGKSRIALLNLSNNVRKYITGVESDCSYPAWSPIYRDFSKMH